MALLLGVISLSAISLSPGNLPPPRGCHQVLLEPETSPNSCGNLFTGEQYDPDLGFYYLRARYSNPDSGRFWTMDFYEGTGNDPLSLHKYLYANADPINHLDPSGHTSLAEVLTAAFTAFRIGSMVAEVVTAGYIGWRAGSLVYKLSWGEIDTVEEAVEESLKIGMDAFMSFGLIKAGKWIGQFGYSRIIGPVARNLTPQFWKRAHELGRAGEEFIASKYSLLRNAGSAAVKVPGGSIPDFMSSTVIREVKNRSKLIWTPQLENLANHARTTGRQLYIHVRPGTDVQQKVLNRLATVLGPKGQLWDVVADVPDAMRVVY